jgi:hypothetical protein
MDLKQDFAELGQIMEEIQEKLKRPLGVNSDSELKIEDLEKLITVTQTYIDKLNTKANEVAKKFNLSRDDMEQKTLDKANFSQEQWNALQDFNQKIEELQKSLIQNLFSQKDQLLIKQEKENIKKRKLKAGRSNWMQM